LNVIRWRTDNQWSDLNTGVMCSLHRVIIVTRNFLFPVTISSSGHRLQSFLPRCAPSLSVAACISGSVVAHINEVTLRRARLVPGWVTVSGFNSRCATFISLCDQPLRSTQPDHPFVGRRNVYQPKGSDALRLGIWFVYGLQVKL